MKMLYSLVLSGFLFALSFAHIVHNSTDNSGLDQEEYILHHNVYFYLNEEVSEEDKIAFEKGLEKLMSIEEVDAYKLGVPASTPEREVTDHSFAYSISSYFKSMDDYEVYADHPIHVKFSENFSELWAEVKVYDSKVTSRSK